jgi:hypothetical protein
LKPPLFGLRELDIEGPALENRSGKNALFLFQGDLDPFDDGV